MEDVDLDANDGSRCVYCGRRNAEPCRTCVSEHRKDAEALRRRMEIAKRYASLHRGPK